MIRTLICFQRIIRFFRFRPSGRSSRATMVLVGDWFHRTIVESGRLPLFCVFAGFLVGFAFIRFSVRMIRAQVSWWPGNVTPGGQHIHHVVFGTVFMIIGGVIGFALPDRALVGLCITASLFGIGMALVLDEFALILHLRDVYWAEEGRSSVDAIFVAVAAVGLLLLGLRPFDVSSGNAAGWAGLVTTIVAVAIDLGLAAIVLIKGKLWTGLIGIFIPFLLIVGAIRVARPASPWARWRYREGTRRGPVRLARAERRERRYREPLIRAKIRLQGFLAGRPDQPVLAAPPPHPGDHPGDPAGDEPSQVERHRAEPARRDPERSDSESNRVV
jgi:hypothetical protein